MIYCVRINPTRRSLCTGIGDTQMKLWTRIALVVTLAFPVAVMAQYKDLDTAMSNLNRGFGSGDAQAIIAGVADGDQVMLQFPGLVDQSGFFGRDQAAYLLDGLFNKIRPTGFDPEGVKKSSADGQVQIDGKWAVQVGGKAEARVLYIILR